MAGLGTRPDVQPRAAQDPGMAGLMLSPELLICLLGSPAMAGRCGRGLSGVLRQVQVGPSCAERRAAGAGARWEADVLVEQIIPGWKPSQ